MKRLLGVAFALIVTVGFAQADDCKTATNCWKGAGWYVIEEETDGMAGGILSGPYAEEGQCNSARPADRADLVFYCEYLGTQPSWDKD